jgi:hypothetical protein
LVARQFLPSQNIGKLRNLATNWFGGKILAISSKKLARQDLFLFLAANQVPTLVALPKYWLP